MTDHGGSPVPPPGYGKREALRVKLRCSTCARILSEVYDFEGGTLVKSMATGRWHAKAFAAKCRTCHGPTDLVVIDADKILAKLAEARSTARVITVKAGHAVTAEQMEALAERHRARHPEPYERLAQSIAEFHATWDTQTEERRHGDA